jgi:hypothetical protein
MIYKLSPPKTICILSEGSTEKYYFERIVEQITDSNFWFEVLIYDSEKSDPFGLVNEAVFLLNEFDEVWAVFDKDNHPKLEEVFSMREFKKIKKAFSSISFEHWVLLHFEKSLTAFSRSEDVVQRLRDQDYLPTYCKRQDYDLYPKIKENTDIAIENSAWLRREKHEDLINQNNKIYMINPYTNVDKLVSYLLNCQFKIIWFKHNDDIIFARLKFNNLSLRNNSNQTKIEFNIENNRNVVHIINRLSNIYIRETSQINNILNFMRITTTPINPGESKHISITFPRLDNNKSYNLIIEDNDIKVIIELEI